MADLANNSFSFKSLLNSTSKSILWDIYDMNKRVYRFSTIFMIILRGYIKRLIDSHKQGKCHSWPDLEENIHFQRNKYNRIKFLIRPMRPNTVSGEGEGEDFRRSDFEALADLITNSRTSCNLPVFPREINDFVDLLKFGDVNLALRGCALWKSKKRVRYVVDIYKEWIADRPEFSVEAGKLNNEEEMCKFIPSKFWTVVEKDKVLMECTESIRDSGEYVNQKQEKFERNFAGLLGFMHKTFKHCTLDSMHILSWKLIVLIQLMGIKISNCLTIKVHTSNELHTKSERGKDMIIEGCVIIVSHGRRNKKSFAMTNEQFLNDQVEIAFCISDSDIYEMKCASTNKISSWRGSLPLILVCIWFIFAVFGP